MSEIQPDFSHFKSGGLAARKRGDHENALEHFRNALALAPFDAWMALDVASELRELGRLDEAEAAYRAILSKDPGSVGGWCGLALLARHRGDRDASLDHYRKAATLEPENAWRWLDVAWACLTILHFEDAETAFRIALTKDPGSLHGWRGLGFAARNRGRHAEALENYQAAAALDPAHLDTQIDVATELRALGRLDEAMAAFRDIAAKSPDSPQVQRLLAGLAREQGDHSAALEYFRAAAMFDPGDVPTAMNVAQEFRELGRLDESEAAYRDILSKDPGSVGGWCGLALLARQRGDRDASLDHYRKAATLEPENAWRWLDVAWACLTILHFEDAETAFRIALTKDPGSLHGWRGLGFAARNRGRHAEALENYQAAAAVDPAHLDTQIDVATELRALGRLDEAMAAFRDIAAKSPDSPQVQRLLAGLARQQGDHAKALEYFRAAAMLDPGDVPTAMDVAQELRELGRLDEAEEKYRALTEREPGSAQGWHGLGQIARQRGDSVEALDHFQKAAALNPQNCNCVLDVAWTLCTLDRHQKASALFDEVARKDPGSPHGWRGLGLTAKRRGRHAEALEHYRKAAAIDPENIGTIEEVADELLELGRKDEAAEILKSLAEKHPDSAQALIAYARGVRHRAGAAELIEIFEKAVAVEPGHVPAKIALANEYFRCWRLDEAEALFDSVLVAQKDELSALMGKGQIARRRGQRAAALAFFQDAASRPPPSDWAVVEFAKELQDAGRSDEARQILADALSRNPDQPSLHMHLGYAARSAGDHAVARQAFGKAATFESGRDQARIELAREEFQEGRVSEAVVLLRRVIEENSGQAQALATLANFAQQLGDLQDAVQLRRSALDKEPSNLSMRTQLAYGLARLGEMGEAESLLAECDVRFGPMPETENVRARILTDQGDHAAARVLLERAAAHFPTNFDIWFPRITALIACGDFDAARAATAAPSGWGQAEKAKVEMLRGQIAAAEWDLDKAYGFFVEASKLNAEDPWSHDCAARMAMLRLDVEAAERHLEASVRASPAHRVRHGGSWKASQTHLGQLLDEFRMDKAVIRGIAECLAKDEYIAALAALVRESPDHTPAAISFIIALRRRGMLAAKAGGASRIPAKIAQFWDENIPADVEALCEGWREKHPDFSYARFSKVEARRFLEETGKPEALAAFDRAREPAMKSDIFRLAWLYREGGFYVDADDRCAAPIPTIDPGGCDLILHQEEFATVGNNFIGASPGHPAIGAALAAAVEAVNRGDSDMVWLATGPGLLTRAVAVYLAEQLPPRLERTLIMERHELSRAVAIHCATAYKHTEKHWYWAAFKQARAQLASIGSFVLRK